MPNLNGEKLKMENSKQLVLQPVATGAMVFGDINDKESKVAALKRTNVCITCWKQLGQNPMYVSNKVRNTKGITLE